MTRMLRLLFIVLASLFSAVSFAKKNKFSPSSVPITSTGIESSEKNIGFYLLDFKQEYEDDFFSDNGTQEDIGNVKYDVKNLSWGTAWLRADGRSTGSLDIIGGIIKGELDVTQFNSAVLGGIANVNADISGFNLGARYVHTATIYKFVGNNGNFEVSWDWAASLLLSAYHLSSTYSAQSTIDNSSNTYDETVSGLFARPLVSLQPSMTFYNRYLFTPFIGFSTRIISGYFKFQDTEVDGDPNSAELEDDDAWFASVEAAEFLTGFDLGFAIAEKSNVTIGAALGALIGGNQKSDFKEFHIRYNYSTD